MSKKGAEAEIEAAAQQVGDLPYAKSVIREDFGMRVKAHIYYNPAKAAAEEKILFDELEKCEHALSEMTEPPAKSLHYDRYFKINRSKDGGVGFIRDTQKSMYYLPTRLLYYCGNRF